MKNSHGSARDTMSKLPALLAAVLLGGIAIAPAEAAGPPQTIERLTRVGQSTIHSTPIGSGAFAAPETVEEQETGIKGQAALRSATPVPHRRANLPIPSKEAARLRLAESRSGSVDAQLAARTISEPLVKGNKVVNFQSDRFSSFNGLSHIDQRTANGGNQFSLEPPDQALCVGNGYVVEAVNDVIRVFDTSGTPLSPVEDLNTFFGLPPAIVRKIPATDSIFGPFLTDPKCFYDAQTRRWFVSELMQDNGTNPGATGRNFNLLAVSQSADPTGAFTVFMYDVTDDGLNGTPNHADCPCFGDQPLLGVDKFGVYQSTNEFPDSVAGFNGAQIYAISKAALVAAADSATAPLPVVVHIDASQQLVPFGGLSYSIQPAVSPRGQDDDSGSFVKTGVEYFLSALQFGVKGTPDEHFDNRIAVWALTNTRSLNTDFPTLTLSFDVIRSETYGQPDPADQKAGPIPLGDSVGESLEQIQTNDDRMNQVIFADGKLYSGVNTKLTVAGQSRTGIAWFAVKPSFDGPTLKGRVVKQGYVAVAGNHVLYPSVGVNEDGEGAIGVTLVGPDYFPSAAYITIDEGGTSPFVHVASAGQGPDDGFTGYLAFVPDSGGAGRWGDYSAAVWDGEKIWFANEYIPTSCAVNALPCRTALANWGTRISKIKP